LTPRGTAPPAIVEHLDPHAEAADLDLSTPYRSDRIAAHEQTDDVGAAGDRGEVNVALDLFVDEIEALRRQR
jgi:hypothetical protein